MAWTADQLAALEVDILKARRVAHGDKSVERHELDKMLKLRDQMIVEINSTARVYRARSSRGF